VAPLRGAASATAGASPITRAAMATEWKRRFNKLLIADGALSCIRIPERYKDMTSLLKKKKLRKINDLCNFPKPLPQL
jgi:hypothetical protein